VECDFRPRQLARIRQPPEEAQLRLAQAAQLQQEAAQLIAEAAVQPFIPISPESTEGE
jgi:hypothetical protein